MVNYYLNDSAIDPAWMDKKAQAAAESFFSGDRQLAASQLRKFYGDVKTLERQWLNSGGDDAAEVRGFPCRTDDDFDAALFGSRRKGMCLIGRTVRGDDAHFGFFTEFFQHRNRGSYNGQIGLAAHKDRYFCHTTSPLKTPPCPTRFKTMPHAAYCSRRIPCCGISF